MTGKTALIVGASGLVGAFCLDRLLREPGYARVAALVRRPLNIAHAKLAQEIVEFERIESFKDAVRGDDLFFCLGTTLARAGSKEAFRKVDFGYAERIARIASENNVKQFLLISSQGADPHSPFFYLRTKGELEKSVSHLPFSSVHIFRPSLLLGPRKEKRPLEYLTGLMFRLLSFLFLGPLQKYRPVEADKTAEAMVAVARSAHPGLHVYEASFIR